jgi:hypothetical protein
MAKRANKLAKYGIAQVTVYVNNRDGDYGFNHGTASFQRLETWGGKTSARGVFDLEFQRHRLDRPGIMGTVPHSVTHAERIDPRFDYGEAPFGNFYGGGIIGGSDVKASDWGLLAKIAKVAKLLADTELGYGPGRSACELGTLVDKLGALGVPVVFQYRSRERGGDLIELGTGGVRQGASQAFVDTVYPPEASQAA